MSITPRDKRIVFGLVAAGVAVVGSGGVAASTPRQKAPAITSAAWNHDCSEVVATSDKDISNIVYEIAGQHYRIEFGDGVKVWPVSGEVTDVWIKSGANHSGDGPGYGEHFERPDSCDEASNADEPYVATDTDDPYDPYGSSLFAL